MIGTAEAAYRTSDEEAKAGVGGQQFRGHEVGPAVSQGKLQGAEHHGKGGRDAELRENLPVVGAICAGPSG